MDIKLPERQRSSRHPRQNGFQISTWFLPDNRPNSFAASSMVTWRIKITNSRSTMLQLDQIREPSVSSASLPWLSPLYQRTFESSSNSNLAEPFSSTNPFEALLQQQRCLVEIHWGNPQVHLGQLNDWPAQVPEFHSSRHLHRRPGRCLE